jgi:Holliday junction resolvase RusA-like endonuclease
MRIQIKPLSMNQAYRGRRFKTPDLKQYQKDLNTLLPKLDIPDGKLEVEYIFGLSSKGSDYDNCIKAFQDCLQDKYGFNDNKIYKATVEKVDVKKGEEI